MFALSNEECEVVSATSLCPCHVHAAVEVSKSKHYTHKLVDKAFYSVDKDTVSHRSLLQLAHLSLGTAVVACAGDETDQHHELIEVDLVVTVEVERFQQLVHFLLVLRSLNNQEKQTLVQVVSQRNVHITENEGGRLVITPPLD